VNGHVQVLSNVVLLEGVPTRVTEVSNKVKQCVSSNPCVFPMCILPQP
jgi:hypothetical protein